MGTSARIWRISRPSRAVVTRQPFSPQNLATSFLISPSSSNDKDMRLERHGVGRFFVGGGCRRSAWDGDPRALVSSRVTTLAIFKDGYRSC